MAQLIEARRRNQSRSRTRAQLTQIEMVMVVVGLRSDVEWAAFFDLDRSSIIRLRKGLTVGEPIIRQVLTTLADLDSETLERISRHGLRTKFEDVFEFVFDDDVPDELESDRTGDEPGR